VVVKLLDVHGLVEVGVEGHLGVIQDAHFPLGEVSVGALAYLVFQIHQSGMVCAFVQELHRIVPG
jgi:hypothetical protein